MGCSTLRHLLWVPLVIHAFAADPYCPAYPASQRTAFLQSEAKLKAFRAFSATRARKGRFAYASAYGLASEDNLIDRHIFGKMQTDGVDPAPQSGDSEFVRRVYLDLTGRIPTVDQALAFLNDTNSAKRSALIDNLLASDAYMDKWTMFYGNIFQVTSGYYQFISLQSRNRFHDYLHDFVAADRSWADVARELLTASGNSFSRTRQFHCSLPAAERAHSGHLGHDYRQRHRGLPGRQEPLHLLSRRPRPPGADQSLSGPQEANRFLADVGLPLPHQHHPGRRRHQLPRLGLPDPGPSQWRLYVLGGPQQSRPSPGALGRPVQPGFPVDGRDSPNRQLPEGAGAHAHSATANSPAPPSTIFGRRCSPRGIVDPPGQWDLARIDPANPPPDPWTLQPTHPELIEALATEFINSNYSVKHMVRLMATSRAYQLSSQYAGTWIPAYEQYFARHIARRLQAEEVYDAVAQATMTITPMDLEGYAAPVYYAGQLPDTTEPRNDGTIFNFLFNFGRGDWWNNPRNSSSTIVQALFMMNDYSVNFRDFTNRSTRVAWILSQAMSDTEAINNLYLAALSRYPTNDELAILNQARTGSRDQWLSDIQWALLNKLDFLFNH